MQSEASPIIVEGRKKRKTELTQEYLKECFDYDPETGTLIWKNRPKNHFSTEQGWKLFNKTWPGVSVNSQSRVGKRLYPVIKLNKSCRLMHRLVWNWNFGSIPSDMDVDHKNRDKKDNRLSNLRLSSFSESSRNRIIRKSKNLDMPVGVHFRCGSYYPRIFVNKKRLHLGCFPTAEAAFEAYQAAAREHFREFSPV